MKVFSWATVEDCNVYKILLAENIYHHISVDDLKWKFLPHWVHCRHTNHSLRPKIKYKIINFLSKGQDFIVTFLAALAALYLHR